MKCCMLAFSNGTMGIMHPDPGGMAAMVGAGYGWDDARITYEVSKKIRPNKLGQTLPLAVAQRLMEGIAWGGLTEAEALLRWVALISATLFNDQGLVTTSHWVREEADMPRDRYFRAAWGCPAGVIVTDMPKARLLHMAHIRTARDKALLALDLPFMRAVETGNLLEQQRIGAEKQVLRDLPQTFNLSSYTTPETLRAAWPAQLPLRVEP